MNTATIEKPAMPEQIKAAHDHNVAVLIKAALDAASEMDNLNGGLKMRGLCAIEQGSFDRRRDLVERIYNACEQLGEKIGVPEEKPPCNHVVIEADVCGKCGAEVPA